MSSKMPKAMVPNTNHVLFLLLSGDWVMFEYFIEVVEYDLKYADDQGYMFFPRKASLESLFIMPAVDSQQIRFMKAPYLAQGFVYTVLFDDRIHCASCRLICTFHCGEVGISSYIIRS